MTEGKPSGKCDVLLFGDYFCDLVITGLREIPRLGADIFGNQLEICPGGAYILAYRLTQLGVRTRWAARFGNDLFSNHIRESAELAGMDAALFQKLDRPYRSMSLSFSYAHERGFISHTDQAPALIPMKEIISTQKPRWMVNTPFDGQPETLELLDFIHKEGGKVFSDCEYTTARLSDPGMRELLRRTDIFAPNLSEASQLTGLTGIETNLESLAEICPLVVLKCGQEGAYARRGSQSWFEPAIDVQAVETTGAGDSFNAGFLAALLNGEDMQTCLQYGNICGGLSTQQPGGISVPISMEIIEDWQRRMT